MKRTADAPPPSLQGLHLLARVAESQPPASPRAAGGAAKVARPSAAPVGSEAPGASPPAATLVTPARSAPVAPTAALGGEAVPSAPAPSAAPATVPASSEQDPRLVVARLALPILLGRVRTLEQQLATTQAENAALRQQGARDRSALAYSEAGRQRLAAGASQLVGHLVRSNQALRGELESARQELEAARAAPPSAAPSSPPSFRRWLPPEG